VCRIRFFFTFLNHTLSHEINEIICHLLLHIEKTQTKVHKFYGYVHISNSPFSSRMLYKTRAKRQQQYNHRTGSLAYSQTLFAPTKSMNKII